jgi:hypothetical protein
MKQRKTVILIILFLILSVACTNKMTDVDFENRSLKIIKSLDTTKIEIFKTWNYTPRGSGGIWFKMKEDSELYRCFYFTYSDSSELRIYGFNNFIKDYSIKIQPVKAYGGVSIIMKSNIIKIISSNRMGFDTLLLNNRSEDSLFTGNNPFNDLKYLSDLKDSLHFVVVHYYARLGGILQFHLSTQHVLTYIPDMEMIDPHYRQEWIKDFSSGKILENHWSLKKYKEPIDFN